MFADVRPGIHTNLRTYTGVRTIIGGMPTFVQLRPAFITQFEGGQRIGSTNVFHWRFMLHAVMDHQANDIAESAIDDMVPLVYQAFSPKLNDDAGHPRATLGGAANMCWFEDVRSGDTDGYIEFGQGERAVTFRRIAFVLMVKTQEAF